MDLSKSQHTILQQLKTRGPQSVKILANRLGITTMGVRQHLEELQRKALVVQTQQEKQTRGRPVHFWKLTAAGHGQFPNTSEEVSVDLIRLVQDSLGEEAINQLVETRSEHIFSRYEETMQSSSADLQAQLETLTRLRSDEGYMAELRLLPDRKWLLVENHCPICAAARACQQFCRSELTMFQRLLEDKASVERIDFLQSGARRCAYRVTGLNIA